MARAAAVAARVACAAASATSAACDVFCKRVFFTSFSLSTRKRRDAAWFLASRMARSASSRAVANSTASRSCVFLIAAQRACMSPATRATYDSRARDSPSQRRVPAPPARTDRTPSRRRSSRRRSSRSPRDERRRPHLLGGFRPSRILARRAHARCPARAVARGTRRTPPVWRGARARVASITSSCLACLARRSSSRRAQARSSPARVRTPSGKPSRRPPRPRSRACAPRCVDACPPRPPGPADFRMPSLGATAAAAPCERISNGVVERFSSS